MNSLTDRDVIDRLAEASQAGVEVIMIIRGICCMLPGVKGRTTGIEIRQIVGRLLEHARIYAFGVDADTIYLSSADMMTRNTERRVEIAYPVLDVPFHRAPLHNPSARRQREGPSPHEPRHVGTHRARADTACRQLPGDPHR